MPPPGVDKEQIVGCPTVLTYSLGQRTRPRYLFLQEHGLEVPISVSSMVVPADELWARQRGVDLQAYREWCEKTSKAAKGLTANPFAIRASGGVQADGS